MKQEVSSVHGQGLWTLDVAAVIGWDGMSGMADEEARMPH